MDNVKILTKNKKARHEYFIEETYEAGLALKGSEVKSIRAGMANIKEAYVRVAAGEVEIIGMHISPYEKGSTFNLDPIRTRKLLLHKKEIIKLTSSVAQKGLTLVPLTLYLKKGLVKLEVGVARGKKLYDKRQDIKARDAQRQQDIASKMSR
ncbi:MAG: SsrA-binding protein SmpB [Clostridia bacterium]|nr:SsrA-binding protein SmpB [Clostridia bacterium]MBT7121661.1 SsrA-binding protein SmpB [Clostridia bacterium]